MYVKLNTGSASSGNSSISTLNNLITNGNFTNGSTNWTYLNTATVAVSNNVLSMTGTGTGNQPYIQQNTTQVITVGDNYYFRAKVMVTDSTCTALLFRVYSTGNTSSPSTFYTINTPVANQWYDVSLIFSIPSGFASGTLNLQIRSQYADATTATNKVTQIKNVLLLNLTTSSFGLQSYTQTQMEKLVNLFPNSWFDTQANETDATTGMMKLLQTTPSGLSKLQGKTIACFGDSIFGNFSAPNDIPTYMSNATGATVYNFGVGGCRMGYHNYSDYDAFSMYRIADAIVTKNYSLQDTAAVNLGTEKVNKVNLLKTIDFTKVDYITIAFGTNDWTGNNSAGDTSDTTVFDYTKYMSAARYALKTILTAYPNVKIMLISPLFRTDLGTDAGNYSDSYVNATSGNKLTDFVDNLKLIGQEFKIPVCDNYYNAGINKYTSTYYLQDQVHPTDIGRQLLGSRIAGQILSNF